MEVVGKVITIISQYPGNFIPIVIRIILFLLFSIYNFIMRYGN